MPRVPTVEEPLSLYDTRIENGPGKIMRALGARWTERRAGKITGWRMSWGEITINRLGFTVELIDWGKDSDHGDWSLHVHVLWLNLFIRLPFLNATEHGFDVMMKHYGFAFAPCADGVMNDIVLSWGNKSFYLYMPWMPTHYRTSRFTARGWVDDDPHEWERPSDLITEVNPYKYVLRSGEIQNVTATISIVEREWRWRWFGLLPMWPFAHVIRSIEVGFSAEVGERSGSWKGGCTGCSYEMYPGEIPEETLRRMERERTF